jgi:universal stress protein E
VKNILVPTDFSEYARTASDLAVWLARKSKGKVTFFHALADFRDRIAALPDLEQWTSAGPDFSRIADAVRADVDKRLAKVAGRYTKTGVPVAGKCVFGKTFVETIHAVQTQGFDLVVLGTRGENAIKRFLVGSTADRLIQHCPAPVYVTHKDQKPQITTVLAAVDFSAASGQALVKAAELARLSKAKLHVVHVLNEADLNELLEQSGSTVPRISRKDLQSAAATHLETFVRKAIPEGALPELHVTHGDSWRMIGTAAKRVDASVIVLSTIGRGGVSGMLLGSTADRILHTSEVGVLVVKPEGFETSIAAPVVSQWS